MGLPQRRAAPRAVDPCVMAIDKSSKLWDERMEERLKAFDKLSELWDGRMEEPFPKEVFRTEGVDGVDLDLLDGDIAGCVLTAMKYQKQLDDKRLKILAECQKEIVEVIPKLPQTAKPYFERLREMAELLLSLNGWKP